MKKAKRFIIIPSGLIDENGKEFMMILPKNCNPKKYFDKQYKKYFFDLSVKCLNVKVVYKRNERCKF